MKVLFRADASLAIGSGHVQRCLALAGALSAKGASCTFVVRDLPGSTNAQIKAAGHAILVLPPQPVDPENDAAETARAIAALGGCIQALCATMRRHRRSGKPPASLRRAHRRDAGGGSRRAV